MGLGVLLSFSLLFLIFYSWEVCLLDGSMVSLYQFRYIQILLILIFDSLQLRESHCLIYINIRPENFRLKAKDS